jgi:hypothetical protein
MPNVDPWINQIEDMTTKTINNFENHLISIKTERQKMIHSKPYPTIMNDNKKL